MLQAGVEV